MNKVHPATQEVSGGTHLGRINISHGDHPCPEQQRNLLRIDPVIFGFGATNRFHIESMSQYEWNVMLSAEISNPVPGKNAFHGND